MFYKSIEYCLHIYFVVVCFFFFSPPQLFHTLETGRTKPDVNILHNPTDVLELRYQEDAAALGAGGWEDQNIIALHAIGSASHQAQGINQVCNSALSASYIMMLGGKACPFFSSLRGGQQTSLQEDAFEYFLPKNQFVQKGWEIKEFNCTRFLPMHTHICVFKASFLSCTVAIPETSLLEIVHSALMQ